jgi:dihydroorotase
MNPPLRTEADRQAIIAGLRDGTLDCIARTTRRTPTTRRTRSSTSRPTASSARDRAAVTLDVLVRQTGSSCPRHRPDDALPRRDARPARRHAGRGRRGRSSASSIRRKNGLRRQGRIQQVAQFPLDGQTLTGRVKTTIVDGRVVFDGGKITG